VLFRFYDDSLRAVQKISVDGLVPETSHHLSHWKNNLTPPVFKADTATEIAFKYNATTRAGDYFPGVTLITNNHFDTDGLLSVWALLNPHRAEPLKSQMIYTSEAGDFCTFTTEEAVQFNLMIEGLRDSPESPIKTPTEGNRDAACYGALLPSLPDLFHKKGVHENLWRKRFEEMLLSFSHFEKGTILLEEYEEERLSVIVDERRPPREAIDRYCQGDLYLVVQDREIETGGFYYEMEYRYYSWADTVVRPKINPIPMEELAAQLNRQEGNRAGKWHAGRFPNQALTSVLKFIDPDGGDLPSSIHPEEVILFVRRHLDAHKGLQA
jgi:hypothetical protein